MTQFLLRRFIRGYEDVQDPAVRERYGTLSGVVGILLNLCLSLGKFLAGLATGYWKDRQEIRENWLSGNSFWPTMGEAEREKLLRGWKKAVACALFQAEEE